MQDVVVGGKHHQHQHQTEPDSEPHFLRPVRQRAPARGFNRIEQKMTAIEQRDREQVQQPDRYRKHGRQMHQRGKPMVATWPEIWAIRNGPPT